MKTKKTSTLGIRISKEEKEALQNEADDRGLTLSNVIKEMISEKIAKKVDTSSPGAPDKNSPGKNLKAEKQESKSKEEKELDNLLESAILSKD